MPAPSRFVRRSAISFALIATAAASIGGTCNNDRPGGEVDENGTVDGASPHPNIPDDKAGDGTPTTKVDPATVVPEGLVFKIKDGAPEATGNAPPAIKADPLGAAETNSLLGRLPPIEAASTDKVDFALREGSKPPPLKGPTVLGVFPPLKGPDGGPPEVKDGPLTVRRYQPEGDVPLAPRVSITFSNPMVAVTSNDMLAKEAVPAKLTPTIEGRWRWVGTKTLFFDPVGRAPMATSYTVEIPAGITDARGQKLAEGKTFKFQTPTVHLISSAPGGDSVDLDPLFTMLFDQKIDTHAILELAEVKAEGKRLKLRELTKEENEKLLGAWNGDKDNVGRWVAFKLTEKLTPDQSVTVTLPAGLGSAEGPRKTEKPQSYTFKTYGPFKLVEARCGWNEQCQPGQPWQFQFTNPIDEDALEASQITVDPPVKGFDANVYGQSLQLTGLTKGQTTYTVTISKTLKDAFGQTLAKDITQTFRVGNAPKALFAPHQGMTILDPYAKKLRLPIYVLNLEKVAVQLYRVTPDQWMQYQAYQQSKWDDDKPGTPPGTKVFDEEVATNAPAEEMTEVDLDLRPGLTGEFGQIVAIVKPVGVYDKYERRRMTLDFWVQVTQLGLDAFVDEGQLVTWVTGLKDGTPRADVAVETGPAGSAKTDDYGLANFALTSSAVTRIVARAGDDVAFIVNEQSWGDGWSKRGSSDQLRWLVYDDRRLYRPTETVNIKGVLRLFEKGMKGGVGALPAGALTKITYTVVDAQGNEIGKGDADVSVLGTFATSFKLPATPNLGNAQIRFQTGLGYDQREYTHSFDIQEFRRPEFEVSAKASDGPFFVGGHANVSATADYFAGGPLPNAEVNWSVSASLGSFSPPNHEEFIFGRWAPWWGYHEYGGGYRYGRPQAPNYQQFKGHTDASGTHILQIDFESVTPPRPMSITAEATVQDVNRQAFSTSTSLLVHPSKLYVGVKTSRFFFEAGKPVDVDTVVADIDGKRQVGTAIEMTMVRLEWKKVKKKGWQEVEVDPETCKIASASEPVHCTFQPKDGGQHRIVARIVDADKRPNETEITVWVPGGKTPADRDLKQEVVQLIPSKKDYAVGETAEFLVQVPFKKGSGIWSVRRAGMVKNTPFSFDTGTYTVKVTIEEWMIPGFTLVVNTNGESDRTGDDGKPLPDAPKRPAFAVGQIPVNVPATSKRLTVEVKPDAAKTEPSADTGVTLTVKDASGKPVEGAEVALVVVDESVLALTNFWVPDPIASFYQLRGDPTQAQYLRNNVMLAAMTELFAQLAPGGGRGEGDDATATKKDGLARAGAMPEEAKMAAMPSPAPSAPAAAEKPEAKPDPGAPIAVRKNFDALAVFAPAVPTGPDGTAHVAVKMPDNLTRYRVYAVAVSGTQLFGSGESTITARLPLMVRMSAPRFLNFGDRFELPVVLQNQTDGPLDIQVAVRATNATLTDGAGRKVRVPANDRVEVRFPISAEMAGTARFQAGAASGKWADAAEVKLPVWTPATTEAFATYGQVDQGGAVQPVKLPEEVVTQFGGLEVQTSSTQLQALTDAFVYLVTYPYDCSEQISSRIMSIAALKDVLGAFKTGGLPGPEELKSFVDRDLKRLRGMQSSDGGWGFWKPDDETWPFLTIHVAHALVRVKAKGFAVDERMLASALGYLRDIRSHMNHPYYTEDTKRTLESYAVYVRNLAGDRDAVRARALLKEGGGVDKIGLELVGWLYPVFVGQKDYDEDVAKIRRLLDNRVSETAGAAHFTTSYGDGAYLLLHSDRRVDGLLLDDLILDQPKSDLIPKLVKGLLGQRKEGRWENTQESAWVLLALDNYFNTYEKIEPNFVVRAWLGDKFAGDHTFKGRTTERAEIDIPMKYLADIGGAADLTLAKDGPGRMYYRIGMRYAPKSLKLAAADYGFHVERKYESVDDPNDVKHNADGTWTVRAGARVKVSLLMHTEDRRYHVALVDPLPAGFEALNPELRGTQATPPRDEQPQGGDFDGELGRGRYYWWWGPWYQHENLRDERAEAFTTMLWEGVYTYTYFARATTPGTFVVPPSKAEEMYAPETFGRGASDVVVVQ